MPFSWIFCMPNVLSVHLKSFSLFKGNNLVKVEIVPARLNTYNGNMTFQPTISEKSWLQHWQWWVAVYFLWTLLLCRFSSFILANVLPQRSHLQGFFPWWTFETCSSRSFFSPNSALHMYMLHTVQSLHFHYKNTHHI